jgi:hypothetical protein
MMTIASSFIFFAVAMDAAYCSGVSILVRPEPIDVESAGVAVLIHEFVLDLDVLRVDETDGPRGNRRAWNRDSLLETVVDAAMTLCPPGACPAGENDADAELFLHVLVSFPW